MSVAPRCQLIHFTNPPAIATDPSQNRQEADLPIGSVTVMEIFKRTAEKYAKLYKIKLPEDDHDAILFSLLKDAKFIDFAVDESGLSFDIQMFKTDMEEK